VGRLSIHALVILGLACLGFAPAFATDGKARTIVLFGARWCAPCMAEYSNLPALAAAAAPDHIALAWVDRKIAPPSAASLDLQSVAVDQARILAQSILGEGYGLPSSVMFDENGNACAIWHAPLHVSELTAFRAMCVAGLSKAH
jgi:thiol-disulfide isomerase/thioredoxin